MLCGFKSERNCSPTRKCVSGSRVLRSSVRDPAVRTCPSIYPEARLKEASRATPNRRRLSIRPYRSHCRKAVIGEYPRTARMQFAAPFMKWEKSILRAESGLAAFAASCRCAASCVAFAGGEFHGGSEDVRELTHFCPLQCRDLRSMNSLLIQYGGEFKADWKSVE